MGPKLLTMLGMTSCPKRSMDPHSSSPTRFMKRRNGRRTPVRSLRGNKKYKIRDYSVRSFY